MYEQGCQGPGLSILPPQPYRCSLEHQTGANTWLCLTSQFWVRHYLPEFLPPETGMAEIPAPGSK